MGTRAAKNARGTHSPISSATPHRGAVGSRRPALLVQRARLSPGSLTTHDVRTLQRSIGNQAVCRLLRREKDEQTPVIGDRGSVSAESSPRIQRYLADANRDYVPKPQGINVTQDASRSYVIQRSPDLGSMEGAWTEMSKPGIVGFLARVIQSGKKGVSDGSGKFTYQDLAQVLQTKEGQKFVTSRWRDDPGEVWGDQVRQGQHEWIPTNNAPTQLAQILLNDGPEAALRFLAASDSLRTPTTEVYLGVDPSSKMVKKINSAKNPSSFKTSQVGEFSHHSAGLYKQDPKHTIKRGGKKISANKMTATGSTSFHKVLDKDVRSFMPGGKLDFPGLLGSMHGHVQSDLWGGEIPGLDPKKAKLVPNDFEMNSTIDSDLHGKIGLTSKIGKKGLETSYRSPQNLFEFQQSAQEGKERNTQISSNRVNALLTMDPKMPLTSFDSQWSQIEERGESYVFDDSGNSVEDYDRMYEEAKNNKNRKLIKELESDDMDDSVPEMSDTPTFGMQGPQLPMGPTTAPTMNEYDERVSNFNFQAMQHRDLVIQQQQQKIYQEVLSQKLPSQQAQVEFNRRIQEFGEFVNGVNQKATERYRAFQQERTNVLQWLWQNETKSLDLKQFQQVKQEFTTRMNGVIDQYIKDLKALYGMG